MATEAALFSSFAASFGWGGRPFPGKAFFESLSIVFVGLGDWQGVLFFVWVLFSWAWVICKAFFSLFCFCFCRRGWLARRSFLCLGFVFVGVGSWPFGHFFLLRTGRWLALSLQEFLFCLGIVFMGWVIGPFLFLWVLFSWPWVILSFL